MVDRISGLIGHFLVVLRDHLAGTSIARWCNMHKLGAFAIRLGTRHVWLWLFLSALANIRCSTAIHSSMGTAATNSWFEDHDSYNATVTLANGSAPQQVAGVLSREVPSFKVPTPQPTRILIIPASDGRPIPLENVHEVKVVKRARGALEGALIGLGVGVVSGLALGLAAGDTANRADCGYPCTGAEKGELAAAVYGGLGTVLGAIVGLAIGHRDILTF